MSDSLTADILTVAGAYVFALVPAVALVRRRTRRQWRPGKPMARLLALETDCQKEPCGIAETGQHGRNGPDPRLPERGLQTAFWACRKPGTNPSHRSIGRRAQRETLEFFMNEFDLDITVVEADDASADLLVLTDDGCGSTCEGPCASAVS